MGAHPIPPGDPAFWHDGERVMQAMTGMRETMEERGRIRLRDQMPDQHRLFFAERSQMFLATLDPTGQPWATLVEGQPGFVTSPTSTQLAIAALLPTGDPAAAGIADGAPIGSLGLEFETRRRNRANGRIRMTPDFKGFLIDVEQSFGNCARYIQARRPAGLFATGDVDSAPTSRRSETLAREDGDLIRGADTFFIASRSAMPGRARSEGLDISHRGGQTGFVLVEDDRNFRFPDYRGNSYFNTLGNLNVDPRCSLLFVDFASGTTLQIAGHGRVINEPEAYHIWPGAERAVGIAIDLVVRTERRSTRRFEFVDFASQFEEFHKASMGNDRAP